MPRRMFRRLRVMPFSTVVMYGLVGVVAVMILGKIAWRFPALHVWGPVLMAAMFCVLLLQLWRIRRIYAESRQAALADPDGPLARTLKEVVRTWCWGNSMVFCVALVCMATYHITHKP
jgi:hypothetical protein